MQKSPLTTFDLPSVPPEMGTAQEYDLEVYLPPLHLAGQDYRFRPDTVPVRLSVIYVGHGYSVAMSFSCHLEGSCWRCLEAAVLDLQVDVEDFFEAELPPLAEISEEDEASLWYSEDGMLNLSEWARDAVVEMLPTKILCRPDCRGLCSQCGANLNEAPCDCKAPTDVHWNKLKEWKQD